MWIVCSRRGADIRFSSQVFAVTQDTLSRAVQAAVQTILTGDLALHCAVAVQTTLRIGAAPWAVTAVALTLKLGVGTETAQRAITAVCGGRRARAEERTPLRPGIAGKGQHANQGRQEP